MDQVIRLERRTVVVSPSEPRAAAGCGIHARDDGVFGCGRCWRRPRPSGSSTAQTPWDAASGFGPGDDAVLMRPEEDQQVARVRCAAGSLPIRAARRTEGVAPRATVMGSGQRTSRGNGAPRSGERRARAAERSAAVAGTPDSVVGDRGSLVGARRAALVVTVDTWRRTGATGPRGPFRLRRRIYGPQPDPSRAGGPPRRRCVRRGGDRGVMSPVQATAELETMT